MIEYKDKTKNVIDIANGSCTYTNHIGGYGYADGKPKDNPMKGDGGSDGSQCRILKTLCGSGMSVGRMIKGNYGDSPY